MPIQEVQQEKVAIENYEFPPEKYAARSVVDLGSKNGGEAYYGINRSQPREKRVALESDVLYQ